MIVLYLLHETFTKFNVHTATAHYSIILDSKYILLIIIITIFKYFPQK